MITSAVDLELLRADSDRAGLSPTPGRIAHTHVAIIVVLEKRDFPLNRLQRLLHFLVVYGPNMARDEAKVRHLLIDVPTQPGVQFIYGTCIAKAHYPQSCSADRQALKCPRHCVVRTYQLRVADRRMLLVGAIEPAADSMPGRGNLAGGEVRQQGSRLLSPGSLQRSVGGHPADKGSDGTGNGGKHCPNCDRVHRLLPSYGDGSDQWCQFCRTAALKPASPPPRGDLDAD